MTEINVPLLRKVLEHITAHRDEWQQHWFGARTDCRTAYCLAGHAVIETGHRMEFGTVSGLPNMAFSLTDGRGIAEVACDELGLGFDADHNAGHPLFAALNSLADLWRIAAELTGGEIEVPAEFQ